MADAPPLPPPAIEQPAPRQVSYGVVSGRAARGTRQVVVAVNGRQVASKPLRGRRFSIRLDLPAGDLALRVTTVAGSNRRSSRVVRDVFGLPAAARPRLAGARNDPALARTLRRLAAGYSGSAGFYVRSLTGGAGAAWNARARFPAASTLKLGIAAAVLASHRGVPRPGSSLDSLLRKMIVPSDDEAANALLVWLAGSTSAGGHEVNALMRSIGLQDSLMYGGYEVRSLSADIPVRVDEQPAFGVGKYTTAHDMAMLHRALWLASGGKGPFRRAQPGITPADARYLLWLLGHVRDTPKLDRALRDRPGIAVLHKAGWISAARHDTGLVFWRGGVLTIAVMTYRSSGAGPGSDVLAGRIAERALERLRRRAR